METGMKRAGFLIFVVAVFAVMAGAVTWRALTAQPAGAGMQGGRAIPVAVEPVETRVFADIVEALGTANANESVGVTAKISDRISRIAFDSGDQVRAGDILVELADAEEVAGLSEARATLREAQRELDRTRDLTERGIAPQARLDEARSNFERARARVTALEARVADRIIRAPFDGVIGLRGVSLGQLVGPGDVIAQLDDVSIIKLDFTLPERFLSVLSPGIEIHARTAAAPGTVFSGEVSNINTRVDPVVRTVTVRAEINNDENRLRPGMLMTVELRRDVGERPAAPETAMTRSGDQVFVFVVENGEDEIATARQRRVSAGRRHDGYVEILSGLQPGELVIAHGVHRVRDGAPVRIRNRRETAERLAGAQGASAL